MVARTSQSWLEMLHSYLAVKLVNAYGDTVLPARCDKTVSDGLCKFTNNGSVSALKPLLMPTGPVFLRFPRLRCSVHNGECILRRIVAPEYGRGSRLVPAIIRAGQVCNCAARIRFPCSTAWITLCVLQKGAMFTPGFLMFIVNSWINSRFVMAGVARDILVARSSKSIDVACDRGTVSVMEEQPVFSGSLALLVPRETTLGSLIRGIWHTALKPMMRNTDIALCQLDGYASAGIYACYVFI